MYINPWAWYRQFRLEAVRAGDQERQKLGEIYEEGRHCLETEPRRTLALYSRGYDLSERLDEPYWSLLFENRRCEIYIFNLGDIKTGLDLAVKVFFRAQDRGSLHCPIRPRIYRTLIDVYISLDPI